MHLRRLPLLILPALILALLAVACWRPAPAVVGARLAVSSDFGHSQGFRRAQPGAALRFPADHGPHFEYQTEWWYFTGNLEDEAGQRWGYQFTLFRRAFDPAPPERASAWAANHIYLAHFAVTDVAAHQHQAEERWARGGAGLAGANGEPLRLWLEDWQVVKLADGSMRLQADASAFAVDLTLTPAKAPVLQGRQGYSQKGAEPGNASYYYSFTRLLTAGNIRMGQKQAMVTGLSWMDHEWSTSALDAGQVGWDWFSIQLDHGWELMAFQLRRQDGVPDAYASATLVDPAGNGALLAGPDFNITALGQWRSPATGAVYPSGWRLHLPGHDLTLTISPLIPDQEMRLSTRYWEGAVSIEGIHKGTQVHGYGYVELTGYSESMEGRF